MNAYNKVGRLDESMVLMAQEKFNQSKEKSVTNTRQRVAGRLYPGKTSKTIDFQKIAKVAAVSILVVGLGYVSVQANTLTDYGVAENKVIREELSTTEQADLKNYQNVTEGNIIDKVSDEISVLSQIDEKKDELAASGEYEWGRLNSQIYPDAIQAVAEENVKAEVQEMNEYLDGGHYGK